MENEGLPERGGPFSALPGASRRQSDAGGGAYDYSGRAQTAQDGRKLAGQYIYPLEGLNALTGLVGAHRDMRSRGCRGVGRTVPGAWAAVRPLEAADGGRRAVRLCEALRGAFALWAV